MNKEILRMQKLAGIITESQAKQMLRSLNEELYDFTNKESWYSFLDVASTLAGKKVVVDIFDTFANQDPNNQKYAGKIQVQLNKLTRKDGGFRYDATLIDGEGYKYLAAANGKPINITFPSVSGEKGGFGNEDGDIAGLFKVKSVEVK